MRNALGGAASGNAITQAEAQLRGLALLQKRVDRASPASLAAIRAEVAASVAATQSFVQQMQGAGSAVTAERAALQQASEAARGTVTDFIHDYYDQKKFDRYLQFASVEDEQEYRRREDERKRAIDKAQAERTPEGNLRALDLSIEQLKDAGAHGADRSPDYTPMLRTLESSGDNLSTQISAAGAAGVRNERKGAAVTAPVDDGISADTGTPNAIARLRAQVSLADPNQEGHGLSATKAKSSATASAPATPSH